MIYAKEERKENSFVSVNSLIQTRGKNNGISTAPVQKGENYPGLPEELKFKTEKLSGISMDDARVHYNSPKPARLQALAYTEGTDIYIAPGQEEHLPHEAWHVVQQKQGRVKPTFRMKDVVINDERELEDEADKMSRCTSSSSPLAFETGCKPVFTGVTQRLIDSKNAKKKARKFLAFHEKERKLIMEANELLVKINRLSGLFFLKEFTTAFSGKEFRELNERIPAIRDKISECTNHQAAIICEYVESDDEEAKKIFLDQVVSKDTTELKPLFDILIKQSTLKDDTGVKFKYCFLSYVLQSMKFRVGEARFRELMSLLGDRKVELMAIQLGGPQGGVKDPDTDNPKSEKVNPRDKEMDQKLLAKVDGNLIEFIKSRFSLEDTRIPNPKKGEIGDLTIIMDQEQKLFPIYFGLTRYNDVELFSSPLFTAIHHEIGHIINALKGKVGRKADKYQIDEGDLYHLTDEEEVYNISIDPYSDKAFSEELGLPVRIAHGAIDGLNTFTPNSLNFKNLFESLVNWEKRTYNLSAERMDLLKTIRKIVNQDWNKYTVGKGLPNGVKKIKTQLESVKDQGLWIRKLLLNVIKIATNKINLSSSRRHKATKEFYIILSRLKINSHNDLLEAKEELDLFINKWFVKKVPLPPISLIEENIYGNPAITNEEL